MFYRNLWLP